MILKKLALQNLIVLYFLLSIFKLFAKKIAVFVYLHNIDDKWTIAKKKLFICIIGMYLYVTYDDVWFLCWVLILITYSFEFISYLDFREITTEQSQI